MIDDDKFRGQHQGAILAQTDGDFFFGHCVTPLEGAFRFAACGLAFARGLANAKPQAALISFFSWSRKDSHADLARAKL
jgi:hypothetical protein